MLVGSPVGCFAWLAARGVRGWCLHHAYPGSLAFFDSMRFCVFFSWYDINRIHPVNLGDLVIFVCVFTMLCHHLPPETSYLLAVALRFRCPSDCWQSWLAWISLICVLLSAGACSGVSLCDWLSHELSVPASSICVYLCVHWVAFGFPRRFFWGAGVGCSGHFVRKTAVEWVIYLFITF